MSTCMDDNENDDLHEFPGQYFQSTDRNGSEVNCYHECEYVAQGSQVVKIYSDSFLYHSGMTHRCLFEYVPVRYASICWF